MSLVNHFTNAENTNWTVAFGTALGTETVSPAKPSALEEGDAILLIASLNMASGDEVDIAFPAGFAVLESVGYPGGNAPKRWAIKEAGASEPENYDVVFTEVVGTIYHKQVVCIRLRDIDLVNTVDVARSNLLLSTTDPTAPSVTTTQDNVLVFAHVGVNDGRNLAQIDGNYPTGWEGIYARTTGSSSSGHTVGLSAILQAEAGATGDATYSGFRTASAQSRSNQLTLRTVAVPGPTITEHPQNQTVTEGQTATFSVTATGEGTLSYQWELDSGSGFAAISGATSNEYTTPETELTDHGNLYRVVVTDNSGSTTSDAATLTVVEEGIVTAPDMTELQEGYSFEVTDGIEVTKVETRLIPTEENSSPIRTDLGTFTQENNTVTLNDPIPSNLLFYGERELLVHVANGEDNGETESQSIWRVQGTTTGLPYRPHIRCAAQNTVGGSGRDGTGNARVLRVTTLDATGPGSISDVNQTFLNDKVPTIVLFDVSGVINIAGNPLDWNEPYLTLAGQSAPGPIAIVGDRFRLMSHNQVAQHIFFACGENTSNPENDSSLGIINASNPMYNNLVDHCAMAWGADGNADTWNNSSVTFWSCMMAEPLYVDGDPYLRGYHQIWTSNGASDHPWRGDFIRSVYMCWRSRAPNTTFRESFFANSIWFQQGPSGTPGIRFRADHREGSVNNPESYGVMVGCYYDQQGGSSSQKPMRLDGENSTSDDYRWIEPPSKFYLADNLAPDWNLTGDDYDDFVDNQTTYSDSEFKATEPPFWREGFVEEDGRTGNANAKQLVLQSVGPFAKQRTNTMQRLISDIENETTSLKSSVADAGGWPDITPTTDPFVLPSDPFDVNPETGYTNIEEALEARAREIEDEWND